MHPAHDADHREGFKFPFVAAELFACDVGEFLDKFLDSPELLVQLFGFLDTIPLNLTLAGYFAKAVVALFNRSPEATVKSLLEHNVFTLVAGNLNVDALAEVAATVLLVEGESFIGPKVYLVQALMVALGSPECCKNSAGVLTRLFSSPGASSWKVLVVVALSEVNIQELVRCVCAEDTAVAKSANSVLRHVLVAENRTGIFLALGYTEDNTLLTAVFDCLGWLHDALGSVKPHCIPSTFGEDIAPLGECALVTAELLVSLVKTNNFLINSGLASLQVSGTLVSLFFQHEWNSIYQNVFYCFVEAVVSCGCQELLEDLMRSRVVSKMARVGLKRTRPHTRNPQLVPGVLAHIKKIFNLLREHAKDSHIIAATLEKSNRWKHFCEQFLLPQNSIEGRPLGGMVPFNVCEPPTEEDEGNGSSFYASNYWEISESGVTLEALE